MHRLGYFFIFKEIPSLIGIPCTLKISRISILTIQYGIAIQYGSTRSTSLKISQNALTFSASSRWHLKPIFPNLQYQIRKEFAQLRLRTPTETEQYK